MTSTRRIPRDQSRRAGRDVGVAVARAGRFVSRMEVLERQMRELEAEQVRVLAEALQTVLVTVDDDGFEVELGGVQRELAHRSLRAELAAALGLAEQTVERRISRAHTLADQYPATLACLGAGDISMQHAQAIVDAGAVIGVAPAVDVMEVGLQAARAAAEAVQADASARRAVYEQRALATAAETTPGRLKPIAKRLAEQSAVASIDERHAETRTHRRVVLFEREDGMADLIAYLPAAEAHAVYNRLTTMSKRIAEAEHATGVDVAPDTAAVESQKRCRDEIRADLLADLLLRSDPDRVAEQAVEADGPGLCGGLGNVRAHVQIVMPVDVVEGAGDEAKPESVPAELTGYGPVDTRTARLLTSGSADICKVEQDRVTGEVISVDRYRPSEAMRRLLAARDVHCRFPGCRVAVHRCDLDHTVDAQYGGETSTQNLSHLCRGHHTLKHHGGWRVTQREEGTLDWTSPAGRKHRERPPSKVSFVAAGPPGRIPTAHDAHAPF